MSSWNLTQGKVFFHSGWKCLTLMVQSSWSYEDFLVVLLLLLSFVSNVFSVSPLPSFWRLFGKSLLLELEKYVSNLFMIITWAVEQRWSAWSSLVPTSAFFSLLAAVLALDYHFSRSEHCEEHIETAFTRRIFCFHHVLFFKHYKLQSSYWSCD